METNYYANGKYLRVWSLVDGYPRCIEDAWDVDTLTEEAINQRINENNQIFDQIMLVEKYEEALRYIEMNPDEPDQTIVSFDQDGNEIDIANPQYNVWIDYKNIINNVTTSTIELYEIRNPNYDQSIEEGKP